MGISRIEKRFNNLDFLLRTRYEWMNEYLQTSNNIIEFGAGGNLRSVT